MMRAAGYKLGRAGMRAAKIEIGLWQPPLLFIAFVAGAVLGSFAGTWRLTVSVAEHVLLEDGSIYGAGGFFELLFLCSRYHLLVLIFGTSLLGVVLIPATFALRGFVLSCTAASIASSYPDRGLILTAVILGLPSLLTVPSLFIVGRDSLCFSSRLLSMYDRRPTPAGNSRLYDFAVCAAALVLAAAIEYALVPKLVELLI